MRTAIDVAIAVLAVCAIIAPSLSAFGVPAENTTAIVGMIAAATAVVSKVRNELEDLGVIPAVLKDSPAEPKHLAE